MRRLIIGLTGAFGSGATFIATEFLEKIGYKKYSLSDVLREEHKKQGGNGSPSRKDLQEFGNTVRENNPAYLAQMLDTEILSKDVESNFVIDSIRNPAEIKYFRDKYPEFILIGLFADYEVRWDRVKSSYNNSKDSFDADEQKDKGALEPTYGQRISDCFVGHRAIRFLHGEIQFLFRKKYKKRCCRLPGHINHLMHKKKFYGYKVYM